LPRLDRYLLALRASRAGHLVTVAEIIEALWPASAPVSARNRVQSLVVALRRRLPDGGLLTALALHRHLGDRHDQADTLTHLGDTHHATGDHNAASGAWRQALDILTDLDHADADAVRAKLDLSGAGGGTPDRS
jgi:DNA-binding SARP family transcriptional activator